MRVKGCWCTTGSPELGTPNVANDAEPTARVVEGDHVMYHERPMPLAHDRDHQGTHPHEAEPNVEE